MRGNFSGNASGKAVVITRREAVAKIGGRGAQIARRGKRSRPGIDRGEFQVVGELIAIRDARAPRTGSPAVVKKCAGERILNEIGARRWAGSENRLMSRSIVKCRDLQCWSALSICALRRVPHASRLRRPGSPSRKSTVGRLSSSAIADCRASGCPHCDGRRVRRDDHGGHPVRRQDRVELTRADAAPKPKKSCRHAGTPHRHATTDGHQAQAVRCDRIRIP